MSEAEEWQRAEVWAAAMTVSGKGLASTAPGPEANAAVLLAADHEPPPLPSADLHAALAEARIQTLYQPIVRMADRCPVALEVLARLDHPTLGMVLPRYFIAPMEQAGLGYRLTEAVLVRAFSEWGAEGIAPLEMALAFNFPPDVLLRREAIVRLEMLRRAARMPAHRIVLELTESHPLTELTELAAVMSGLRALGYGVAIDDLSRDMGGFPALLGLPFTVLKLDKALVRDAAADASAREFVHNAIAAAHRAGMQVTAEGIESEAVWTGMQALGADFAQGYLVSRPLAADAVPSWHRQWCGSD